MNKEVIYVESNKTFIIGTNVIRESNLTAEEAANLKLTAKRMNLIYNTDKDKLINEDNNNDRLIFG